MEKINFFSILFIVLISTSFAQVKRADKYYSNYDYAKAIQLYKKAVKKKENPEALEKLANSYRLTKNYPEAELAYSQLMKQSNIAPINHFYYGMVLKNNNKIDAAKEQFKLYAAEVPTDKRSELSVRSCDDIKLWISKTQQFEINNVADLNSVHVEFCPVLFKDQLVFVSDRTKDLVNDNNFSWNQQPFLNVYSTVIKKGKDGNLSFSKKAKPFSWPINTTYHDGPISFNAEQNTMYITRVDYVVNKKDKDFVNRSKLYTSTLKEKKWSKPQPFQYNNDAYSVAHPSISVDGQELYFASDMQGGEGGMDIYFCEKGNDGWGKPHNLGPEVNTSADEVFPYIRKDGTLYFSSDGHSGFGGLDIFSATKIENKFSSVKNLGLPLNSSTDDFGIVFLDNNTKGYFSSDRTGGQGNDDIYSFTALNKFLSVSGKILLSQNINDPIKNAKITLLTEDGNIVNITTTDSTGFFKFANLDPDKKYMVKLDETDPMFATKNKYYMADDKDRIVRVTVINEKGGKFVFQNLPTDPNSLSEIPALDDISIAGNILFGESPSKPLANTKVNLVNEKGEIIQTSTTNAFGAFVFSNLPAGQNFLVRVDETDTELATNTKIIITNKSGKEIQTTKSGSKGGFKFFFLSSDKNSLKAMVVEDTELRFDFKGKLTTDKNIPIVNSIVNLVNEKSEILRTTKTDANGNFVFINLPGDKNTLIALDENDPQIKTLNEIYLVNDKGIIVKVFSRMNNKFKFTILQSDQNKLGQIYVDDPWLKVLQFKNEAKKDSLTIVENVYYNYGEYKILPEAQKALDKVINLMKNDLELNIELSSHTDSRSTSDYNMKLSQQRAKAAVDYIIAGGVAKNRISGKGYGESKLINKCGDGVECTQEEHAKNRRTEFKILRKQK